MLFISSRDLKVTWPRSRSPVGWQTFSPDGASGGLFTCISRHTRTFANRLLWKQGLYMFVHNLLLSFLPLMDTKILAQVWRDSCILHVDRFLWHSIGFCHSLHQTNKIPAEACRILPHNGHQAYNRTYYYIGVFCTYLQKQKHKQGLTCESQHYFWRKSTKRGELQRNFTKS